MGDAPRPEANPSSLTGLVENALRQADRGRPAIIAETCSLSYGQLDTASAVLAGELAGNRDPVAIVLPRGAEATTAMIACIRVGRPFLPLSPAAPEAAAETIISAGASTVIGDAAGPHPWDTRGIRTILTACPADRPLPSARARPQSHPGGLGYLLATSGTSGSPKLVRGSARALARYLSWQRQELSLGPEDVLSHTAQPWFDFSFKETLGAVTAGATVTVAPAEALSNGRALLTWLAEAQPTTVCLLPSRLVMLVAAMERAGAQDAAVRAALRRLRWLLVSGELFPASLFRRWRAIAAMPTVLNLYGPTESTVIKLRHVLEPDAVVSTATVPVGTPIPGTRVELLPPDEGFPGAGEDSGELCLVSDDLALGYAGTSAEWTRFDQDEAGRPRLRTGDLARRTPDGAFEFIGRMDRTVKRRGVKVSLPAIEAAAQELPMVDLATAVECQRPQGPGDSATVIVLFCGVSAGAGPGSLRQLRAKLIDRLDFAAMPDMIRLLPEFPLDNRGKVDAATLRMWAAALADERGRL